ncbi:M16 family metallopeptidase [Sphingopyxis sp. R3-92]|uniref:M16 family metallopeptidase n=1 Tax=Sphingopyxis sp. R3-92 TaxID=3158553 RepID=UPI003EE478F1
MMKPIRGGLLLAALVTTCLTSPVSARIHAPVAAAAATSQGVAGIDIPHEEFTLPNGLRVIVQTDHTVPVVAVNIWYHVGSRNEDPGRTGFAHLFEHLMFQGSENHRDEYFRPFEQVGVTDRNGTTSFDRTNYYQTVPTPALDMALWMESDRMGHFLGAVTQEMLDEQRGVVHNEKKQRDGQPYGLVMDELLSGIFQAPHPYSHMPIGSSADLDAANLEDVQAWFKSWYGPNNAVLVLVGDVTLADAKKKAKRYFGHIAPSASVPKDVPDTPRLTESTRAIFPDRVPHVAIYRAWPAPHSEADDAAALQVLGSILGGGGSSRLRDRLIQRERVSTAVSAGYSGLEIAGVFSVTARVNDGVEAARVEALLDEEVRRMIAEGPTQAELDRVRFAIRAALVKGLPKVSMRAEILNQCATLNGRADCWREGIERLMALTPDRVRQAAKRWLDAPSHTVEVQKSEVAAGSLPEPAAPDIVRAPAVVPPPDPKFRAVGKGIDRSRGVPQVTEFPELELPPFQYATLSNGIDVTVVERSDAPLLTLAITLPGGVLADRRDGGKPLRASLTGSMLSRGAGNYDALEFAARAEEIGAQVGGSVSNDFTSFTMQGVKEKLGESLDLLNDLMFRPQFDATEIERTKEQAAASLASARSQPAGAVRRIVPHLLYGPDHLSGELVTEEVINAVTREDMVAFHKDRMRADGAQIVVVGDTTMAEIMPILEARFGSWKKSGAVEPAQNVEAALPAKPRVFLIDQPGAPQSMVAVAQLIPGQENDAATDAIDMATGVLGGGFVSRLNMNLREDKSWSYGAGASSGGGKDQRAWSASAMVQADRTADSMREIRDEIARFVSRETPATKAEIDRQKATLYALPGGLASNDMVAMVLLNARSSGWPDDYIEQYAARVRAMTPEQVTDAFARTIRPDALTWVVMGPLDQIEEQVRALDLGTVTVIDSEGKIVKGR